jgi:hypothetical protein
MGNKTTAPKAMAILKRCGYVGGVVERSYGGFSHDWCGFADIMVCRVARSEDLTGTMIENDVDDTVNFDGMLAVQSCTSNNLAQHIHKVLHDDSKKGVVRRESLREFLESGNRFEIWSFPSVDWIRKNPNTSQEKATRVRRVVYEGGEFYLWDNSEAQCFGFTPKMS